MSQGIIRKPSRIASRYRAHVRTLAGASALGRARPEIHADARSLVIERWLALYYVGEDGARIVRVIDGARDLKRVEWARE